MCWDTMNKFGIQCRMDLFLLLAFLVVKVHTDAMSQLRIGNYRFSASCTGDRLYLCSF